MSFIRIYSSTKNVEVLLNLNSILRIEVSYAIPQEGSNDYFRIPLDDGIANPEAVRVFRIFSGGEEYQLIADNDDPVSQAIEEIYKNAIKN